MKKTTTKYLEARKQFIILLKKYNLDTPAFIQLVQKLDSHIPNLFPKQQQSLIN
jgi:hypothetical protein